MKTARNAATKHDKAKQVLAFLASSGADTVAALGTIGHRRISEMAPEELDDLILAAWHIYCGEVK